MVLSYQASAKDSDARIQQLRELPNKESKTENELSHTAKAMRKQRNLREWKKMEKEENSGKRSLEASPTIETNRTTRKKKKGNEIKDDPKYSGESEIKDKKFESEHMENMDTQSVKSIERVATSNASNDKKNNSCKAYDLLVDANSYAILV